MSTYWADEVAAELSQGDLLQNIWVGTSTNPRRGLQAGSTLPKGIKSWIEGDWKESDGFGHFLARGQNISAVVISQSCELDKQGGKMPVLVAPVLSIDTITVEAMRDNVREGRRHAFLPLPAIAGLLQESYLDLRRITHIPRPVIDLCDRVRSVSTAGEQRLIAQLVLFLTRIDEKKIRV